MSKQEVIICHNLEENLNKAINQCPHDKLFVLADEHHVNFAFLFYQNLIVLKMPILFI